MTNYLVWEMRPDVSSVLFWLPGVEWLKPDGTCTTFYSVNILALGFPTWPQVSVVCIANPITESTIQNMTKSHLIMIWSHAPSTGQNEKFFTLLFFAPPLPPPNKHSFETDYKSGVSSCVHYVFINGLTDLLRLKSFLINWVSCL